MCHDYLSQGFVKPHANCLQMTYKTMASHSAFHLPNLPSIFIFPGTQLEEMYACSLQGPTCSSLTSSSSTAMNWVQRISRLLVHEMVGKVIILVRDSARKWLLPTETPKRDRQKEQNLANRLDKSKCVAQDRHLDNVQGLVVAHTLI